MKNLDPGTYKKGPHDVTRFIKRTSSTICYTALLIYRLLEKKLDMHGTHFTIDNVIETRNSMDVANIEDMCYMSTYTGSEVCTALNAVTGLGLDKKYYQPKELNKKTKKFLK